MNQRINLFLELPDEGQDRFPADKIIKYFFIFIILLIVLYGGFYFQQWQLKGQIKKLQAQQKVVQDQIIAFTIKKAETKGKEPAVKTIAQLEREVGGKKRVIAELSNKSLSNTAGFSPYLIALSESSVRGMSVERIDIQQAGSDVVIKGKASKDSVILQFIRNLMGQPLFLKSRFELTDLSDTQQAGQVLVFTLKIQEVA